MSRRKRYFDYTHDEIGITRAEFYRLCKAVEDGAIPESIAFDRRNLSQYRYEKGGVDRLIRTWSGSSYEDPYENREIDISLSDFEDIVHEAASMTQNVRDYKINGTTVFVRFWSNSGKQSWGAEYDFNDDGRITGHFRCHSSYQYAKAPRWFGENVNHLIRRLIDEEDYR